MFSWFRHLCIVLVPTANNQVVNVDKERMQYTWRLSGAGHSLSLSCTLRGNTGVQVRTRERENLTVMII